MASRAVPSLVVEASERCRGPSRRALSALSRASSVSDTLEGKITSEHHIWIEASATLHEAWNFCVNLH